ncbi:MAG TPA: hypothetical protein VMN36_00705 [Verrucomicrobiales bacterium]|nr:hypothetical protein [Verrucomicrobiales bacterium]
MNMLSILIGIVAALLMFLGLVPFLGWLNWLVLAICVIGVIFGALSREKSRAGLIVNIAVGLVSMVRLIVGGGFI